MEQQRGKGDYRTERINSYLRYPVATVALLCKFVHYDIAYVRKMNATEQFRMSHPGMQDGTVETEQLTYEEVELAQSKNSSSSITSNQDTGRPHEASAQQNRDYQIPGD